MLNCYFAFKCPVVVIACAVVLQTALGQVTAINDQNSVPFEFGKGPGQGFNYRTGEFAASAITSSSLVNVGGEGYGYSIFLEDTESRSKMRSYESATLRAKYAASTFGFGGSNEKDGSLSSSTRTVILRIYQFEGVKLFPKLDQLKFTNQARTALRKIIRSRNARDREVAKKKFVAVYGTHAIIGERMSAHVDVRISLNTSDSSQLTDIQRGIEFHSESPSFESSGSYGLRMLEEAQSKHLILNVTLDVSGSGHSQPLPALNLEATPKEWIKYAEDILKATHIASTPDSLIIKPYTEIAGAAEALQDVDLVENGGEFVRAVAQLYDIEPALTTLTDMFSDTTAFTWLTPEGKKVAGESRNRAAKVRKAVLKQIWDSERLLSLRDFVFQPQDTTGITVPMYGVTASNGRDSIGAYVLQVTIDHALFDRITLDYSYHEPAGHDHSGGGVEVVVDPERHPAEQGTFGDNGQFFLDTAANGNVVVRFRWSGYVQAGGSFVVRCYERGNADRARQRPICTLTKSS